MWWRKKNEVKAKLSDLSVLWPSPMIMKYGSWLKEQIPHTERLKWVFFEGWISLDDEELTTFSGRSGYSCCCCWFRHLILLGTSLWRVFWTCSKGRPGLAERILYSLWPGSTSTFFRSCSVDGEWVSLPNLLLSNPIMKTDFYTLRLDASVLGARKYTDLHDCLPLVVFLLSITRHGRGGDRCCFNAVSAHWPTEHALLA